jgi:hypothetical protein
VEGRRHGRRRGHARIVLGHGVTRSRRENCATTGALAARLLRSIEWSKDTRKAVDDATKKLAAAFGAEPVRIASSVNVTLIAPSVLTIRRRPIE